MKKQRLALPQEVEIALLIRESAINFCDNVRPIDPDNEKLKEVRYSLSAVRGLCNYYLTNAEREIMQESLLEMCNGFLRSVPKDETEIAEMHTDLNQKEIYGPKMSDEDLERRRIIIESEWMWYVHDLSELSSEASIYEPIDYKYVSKA